MSIKGERKEELFFTVSKNSLKTISLYHKQFLFADIQQSSEMLQNGPSEKNAFKTMMLFFIQ